MMKGCGCKSSVIKKTGHSNGAFCHMKLLKSTLRASLAREGFC